MFGLSPAPAIGIGFAQLVLIGFTTSQIAFTARSSPSSAFTQSIPALIPETGTVPDTELFARS